MEVLSEISVMKKIEEGTCQTSILFCSTKRHPVEHNLLSCLRHNCCVT